MSTPIRPEHAGWFDDVRRLIDVTEVTPGLPLPRIAPDRAVFFYVSITRRAEVRQAMAEAETILRSAFLAAFHPLRYQAGSTRHYILRAVLPSGLFLDLVAMAEHFDDQDAREDMPVLAGAAA